MVASVITSAHTLFDIVEVELSDLLGTYAILSESGNSLATAPAIWMTPPQVPTNRKVKEESGIEVIIEKSPRLFPMQYLGSSTKFEQRWQVFLTQYNTIDTTQFAAQRLTTYFDQADVEIRPQMNTEEGLTYEQARITIPEYARLAKR